MGRDVVKYRRPRLIVPPRAQVVLLASPQMEMQSSRSVQIPGQFIDGVIRRHHHPAKPSVGNPVHGVSPHDAIDVHILHDQIISAATADGIFRRRHIVRRLVRSVKPQYVMAGLVFVFGLGVSIQGMLVNHQAEEQVQVLSASTASAEKSTEEEPVVPAEEKPQTATVQKYTVAPDLPRFISIPAIGASGRVLQVGVNRNNALGVPSNVHDAAWYRGSNRPGEAGAMLIDGHVSGPSQKGIFYNLKKLKAGDTIEIERGDGQKFTFAVRHLETVPVANVDMAKLLVPYEPGKSGLNLITCGGKFDPKTSQFSDRVLVYAVAI